MIRTFKTVSITLAALVIMLSQAFGARLTIVHTNDLHSYLLGFSPNIEYTPDRTGDDPTLGGWARISSIIKSVKKNRDNPVLVLDAGDFLMGTLFHTICREHALELRLLKDMGYDAVALGNHEFDITPSGLARVLNSAHRNGKMPTVLLSNAAFSKESPKDDTLEKVFTDGNAGTYAILTRGGIRIGLFALLGKSAAEYSPFASPVSFNDIVETSKKMVAYLRNEKKSDLVICLSHSGLSDGPGLPSEDETLARKVNGIDIIISGHTHTVQPEPITVGKTIIVQAGEYGKRVGVLDFDFDGTRALVRDYRYVTVDDSIPADPVIQGVIQKHIPIIEKEILSRYGLGFYQVIAETKFDIVYSEEARELTMGNLMADSLLWYANKYAYDVNRPETKVVAAIESTGLIRESLFRGVTGKLAVCDIFNAFPLGIGFAGDGTMGYPVVTLHVTGSEIKKTLEVLTSIAPLKGNSYYLQVSGIKFTYNPNRMIFDRVTGIWMGDRKKGFVPLDYSGSNRKLYRVAANIYNATFLKIIGGFTFNMLNITPKDSSGNPIEDLTSMIVYQDTEKKQPLKEWIGLIEYMKSFPDTDGNGIPDVPENYRNIEGRIGMEASWNPVSLLRRANWLTWSFLSALILILAGIVIIIKVIIRKVMK